MSARSPTTFVPVQTAEAAYVAGVEKGVAVDHQMHNGWRRGPGAFLLLLIVIVGLLGLIFWFSGWAWTKVDPNNPLSATSPAKVWGAAILIGLVVLILLGAIYWGRHSYAAPLAVPMA